MKTIYNSGYRIVIQKLIDARNKKGMRQVDVGRRMMKSKQWVSRVEICQLRLDIVHFVQLCRICGIKSQRLIEALEESLEEDSFLAKAGVFYSPTLTFLSIKIHIRQNPLTTLTVMIHFLWLSFGFGRFSFASFTNQFCEFYKYPDSVGVGTNHALDDDRRYKVLIF